MKTAFQVLFGLALGVASMLVCLYLGLLVKGEPDWRTALMVIVLLGVTQWLSYFSFRHRIAIQVLFGASMCMAIAILLLYSSFPMFWEHEDHNSYLITWRSDLVFLLLLAFSQWFSYLVFHHRKSQ